MKQEEALDLMKMGHNVYLTGEAGTGKTYVLTSYIKYLKGKKVPVAVTASTGIAATHLDGTTLDAWSGIGVHNDLSGEDIRRLSQNKELKKRFQITRVLIIDEVSMLHARRFDAIDKIARFMRDNARPFGNLQVILCGDLYQLPPVSEMKTYTDYVFKSDAWTELNLRICYLNEPKRQNDLQLIKVLRDIRYNRVCPQTLDILNQTMHQSFASILPPTKLYTHNEDVDAINLQQLKTIDQPSHFYAMSAVGNENLVASMKHSCLAPEMLELKKGALVMFVRNNYEKGYVNGTLGTVVDFDKKELPIVKTASNTITVQSAHWTIADERNRIIAQLIQLPLRLAWAITVHKSQGMTLDAAEIDLSKSFVEGMGYVALSRVRSLKNLKLLGINDLALKVNPEVSEIDKQLIERSEKASAERAKLSWLQRWLKKYQFVH